jgi:hypothetical protein
MHFVLDTRIETVLVERAVNEEVGVTSGRKGGAVDVAFNDVVGATGHLRPVLDSDVFTFPVLVVFASPFLVRE